MALKGTLKDFSVADIFQLIGQQQKSGSLYIRTQEKEAHILFDAGKVVLGTFRKSDEDFLFGTMLLRAGVISSDQLSKAMENQKVTMRSLGDILKTMGVINNSTLGEFVTLQLKEVLFRVFQWKDGFYEFVPEQVPFNKAVIKPQSAESVLMDGFRMLDEWPRIQKAIPSMEFVFRPLVDPLSLSNDNKKKIVDPIEAAFGGESDSTFSEEDAISDAEKNVLTLMNGHRSLQEVSYLSRLGTFESARIAMLLLEQKLIEKVDQLAATRVDSKVGLTPSPSLIFWARSAFKPLLFLFVLSFLTPRVLMSAGSNWHRPLRGKNIPQTGLPLIHTLSELRHVQDQLNLYRLERRRYPTTLEEILSSKNAKKWNYTLLENGYSIFPLNSLSHE